MKNIISIDSRNLLQKNYKSEPVACDSCHEVKEYIYLCGGGWRRCIKCELIKNDSLKLEVLE